MELPVDKEENIDWKFMENYMKRMENKLIKMLIGEIAIDT